MSSVHELVLSWLFLYEFSTWTMDVDVYSFRSCPLTDRADTLGKHDKSFRRWHTHTHGLE